MSTTTPATVATTSDLERACTRWLWAVAFLVVDLTIDWFDLLHDAIGWAFVVSAIGIVATTDPIARDQLSTLRTLSIVALVASVVATFATPALDAGWWIGFALFTDLVVYVAADGLLQVTRGRRLGTAADSWRTTRTLAATSLALTVAAAIAWLVVSDDASGVFQFLSTVAGLVAAVHLVVSLVRTRTASRVVVAGPPAGPMPLPPPPPAHTPPGASA